LIIQQNYFSDLYPAKILDLSAPFFLCDTFLLEKSKRRAHVAHTWTFLAIL